MRSTSMLILVSSLSSMACTVVESDFTQKFPASGISTLVADVDQGDVEVQGIALMDAFHVEGRTFGYSVNSDNAERNQDANTWDVSKQGDILNLWGQSEYMLDELNLQHPICANKASSSKEKRQPKAAQFLGW